MEERNVLSEERQGVCSVEGTWKKHEKTEIQGNL